MQDISWEEDKLLEEKYGGEKTEGFFADQKRLRAGEPLAYLIGHMPFLGAKIYLDSRPLIPRPETEYWTKKAIEFIGECSSHTPHILDLCAGSGCIGVAVLSALPQTTVDFAEIDESHHSTIKKSIEINGIKKERARIFGGNLFENITDRYEFILTNPPYIDPKLDRTEESVKKFEPHGALYGGTEGLQYIKMIIEKSKDHLKESGILFIEHEPEQAVHIHEHAKACGLITTMFEDQFGVLRYTQLSCP